MKRTKQLAFLLALALLVAALFGCQGSTAPEATPVDAASEATEAPLAAETPPEAAEPIVITDMMGREVRLEKPATRIVALTAADCEILYALGAGETLVGRGEYCNYPPEVNAVTSVQSGFETNTEQIIALSPDLLFMNTMTQSKEQVEQLEAAGIQVVVSNAQDIEGVYAAIRMIGTLLGEGEKAEALVTGMQEAFKEITATAGDGSETVYFEVSPLEWGLWTAGTDTFMDEVAGMLGLKNCFSDVSGWAEISEEQVLERNPDYILTIAMYAGEGPTPEEEIAARPGWDTIKAVQNGAILNLQNDELSRPGPRLVDGARALSEFVQGVKARLGA